MNTRYLEMERYFLGDNFAISSRYYDVSKPEVEFRIRPKIDKAGKRGKVWMEDFTFARSLVSKRTERNSKIWSVGYKRERDMYKYKTTGGLGYYKEGLTLEYAIKESLDLASAMANREVIWGKYEKNDKGLQNAIYDWIEKDLKELAHDFETREQEVKHFTDLLVDKGIMDTEWGRKYDENSYPGVLEPHVKRIREKISI